MIGDELIGKLWDTVTKGGIGSIAAPWQTRRQGRANVDARRDELLMLAQTEVDVADIKAGKKRLNDNRELVDVSSQNSDACESITGFRNGRIEPYFCLGEIECNADARFKAQRIQEQINVTKAVLFAEEELEINFTEGSEKDVEEDWFVRWRECAGKVSNEDLQRLWAKALAGEIASPGTYSLRTLEFLKNISRSEAHDIAKLAPYVIESMIFKVPCLELNGMNFPYLLEMEDLGILSGVKGGGLTLTKSSQDSGRYQHSIFHNQKILLLTHESQEKKAEFVCYKVTKLGCEVLNLGVFPKKHDYLEEIGIEAKKQGFKAVLGDWVQTSREYGNYYNAKTL